MLDDGFQLIQLLAVEFDGRAVVGVDAAVGKLGELVRQRSSICRGDDRGQSRMWKVKSGIGVGRQEDQVFFQAVVLGLLARGHRDRAGGADQVRELEIVRALHGDADVRDGAIDGVFRAGFWLVGEDHLPAAPIRDEVALAVAGDGAAETLTHVDEVDLGPEILQAIRGRGGGETDEAGGFGTDLAEGFEALRLGAFEGTELIDDDAAAAEVEEAGLDKPGDLFAVGDVDQGGLSEGRFPRFRRTGHDRIREAAEMIPLLNFIGPGGQGDADGRDDQDTVDLETVKDQFLQGGEGDDGLAEAEVKQQAAGRMGEDEVDGVLLVRVWSEVHNAIATAWMKQKVKSCFFQFPSL